MCIHIYIHTHIQREKHATISNTHQPKNDQSFPHPVNDIRIKCKMCDISFLLAQQDTKKLKMSQ